MSSHATTLDAHWDGGVSPFGATGPKAAWRATDLTIAAASGQVSITGDRDRAPVRISVPQAWANAAAYHASKWGLIGFGRGLGVEGRPDNIRVTTIIPGGMRTHFFDRFAEQGIPMPDERNLQDPANVADTIVFAVSLPPQSALQEVIVTPLTETSWP